MISKIDTIEISLNKANIRDLSVLEKIDKNTYKKAYIQKVIDRSDKLFIVIHNDYHTSKETYTLEYFFNQVDYILNDLDIIDVSQVKLNRLDYCFDYINKFEDMYKQNNVLVLLYALEINADFKNIIETNTILDQQKTSLQAYNRGNTRQLYVYDKEMQSENRHTFNTRQEFRVKRLNVSLTRENILNVVNEHIDVLVKLESKFKQMQEQRIGCLYELYLKEYEQKKVHSFTSFITRYEEQIGTRYVCKELYKATGHRGKFENWLKEYRKKVNIRFISKTDTKYLLADMRKSIKLYLGSDTTLFLCKKIEPIVAICKVFIMPFCLLKVKCKCLC